MENPFLVGRVGIEQPNTEALFKGDRQRRTWISSLFEVRAPAGYSQREGVPALIRRTALVSGMASRVGSRIESPERSLQRWQSAGSATDARRSGKFLPYQTGSCGAGKDHS